MQSKTNTTRSVRAANQTLSGIVSGITKLQKQATGKGVDTSNCTNKTLQRILGVGIDFAARTAGCPIDEATKAIAMINKDIEYISELINLTMYTPQALNKCLSTGKLSAQSKCVSSYLGSTATKLVNAPATVTSMVNDVYAYTSVFPTNVAVCVTNTSFAVIGNAAALAFSITSCITDKILNS